MILFSYVTFGFWAWHVTLIVMWAQWVCSVLCDVYMCGSGNVVCVCYSYPHDNYNFLATTVSYVLTCVYERGIRGECLLDLLLAWSLSIVWAIVIARQTRVKPKKHLNARPWESGMGIKDLWWYQLSPLVQCIHSLKYRYLYTAYYNYVHYIYMGIWGCK